MRWSEEEDLLLKNNYQLNKFEILLLLPNRTEAAINIRASFLGLRKIHNEYCKSNISILLDETHQSYYWVGFILADGSFSGPNQTRLKISLAIKDIEHLNKFAKYIKCDIKSNNSICSIACQDKYYIPLLRNKFYIKPQKTYNPPDFNNLINSPYFISLIVGYSDGDGCLNKQYNREDYILRYRVHSSWLDNLNYISDYLSKRYNTVLPKSYISKDGYAILNIANNKVIKSIKKDILKFNIPHLTRKFGKVKQ